MIRQRLIAARVALCGITVCGSEAAVKPNYSIIGTSVLQRTLLTAQSAWGMRAEVNLIQWKDLGPCNGKTTMAAWSDLGERSISLNQNCRFTPRMLQIVVNHEYGHMLMSNETHSSDPNSVMYAQLRNGQTITPNDIALVIRTHALRADNKDGK